MVYRLAQIVDFVPYIRTYRLQNSFTNVRGGHMVVVMCVCVCVCTSLFVCLCVCVVCVRV
jgi:hypothetical protein